MIFLASVEVEPLPGCEMNGQGIGAAVYCLIPAENEAAARVVLETALLSEDKYQITNVEYVSNYNELCWDDAKDQREYDKLAKRAALNNDVVYGTFYAWDRKNSR